MDRLIAMKELTEIRWHGRGGQGAVTASEILAEAALEEGKYFQAFPDYGPERMGAPIRAYTRISTSPIRQHCQITAPDAVVVLDPTLIGIIDFTEGIKDNGVLVVNTTISPGALRKKLGLNSGRVFTVDATRIAMDTIGRNIPNTPIIGALIKAIGAVSKEHVREEIRKRMGSKAGKKMADANIEAFERAYDEVKEG
jgi:pyruvate ferredoxin oxidoreductase gamma subunit